MYENYSPIYCKIMMIAYNIDKIKITIILRKSFFHYEDMPLK